MALHNSRPSVWNIHVTSVADVVVREKAYTLILFVGVTLIVPVVAEMEPVEPVSVLPTIGIVETEFVTITAVDVRETEPATVTAVDVKDTFTGLAAALFIVEAVVERVTVPVIVTVPKVALDTFTFPATVTVPKVAVATFTFSGVLSIVTLVEDKETVTVPRVAVAMLTFPDIVTVPSVAVATLTLSPEALSIVTLVEDKDTDPLVIATIRLPSALARTGQASAASLLIRLAYKTAPSISFDSNNLLGSPISCMTSRDFLHFRILL